MEGTVSPSPKEQWFLSFKAIGFEPNESKYLKKLFPFKEQVFRKKFSVNKLI